MPQLGLGLRANVSGISFYDGDAASYFSRAGITDATAKKQINDFVVGVKALGLWNNMVCWPLRSTQNAGTGTTAYSLGGYGIFNGTLTNGPTWGTDGINFDGINDFISTNLAPPDGNITIGFCSTCVFPIVARDNFVVSIGIFATGKMILDWTSNGGGLTRLFADKNGSFDFNVLSVTGTATANRIFCQASHDGSNFYAQKDANTIQSSAYSGSVLGSGNFYIGASQFGTEAHEGNNSFAFYMSSSSHANFTNFYTLYKNTLGQGLGLP
jgi:hypothetical protein